MASVPQITIDGVTTWTTITNGYGGGGGGGVSVGGAGGYTTGTIYLSPYHTGDGNSSGGAGVGWTGGGGGAGMITFEPILQTSQISCEVCGEDLAQIGLKSTICATCRELLRAALVAQGPQKAQPSAPQKDAKPTDDASVSGRRAIKLDGLPA